MATKMYVQQAEPILATITLEVLDEHLAMLSEPAASKTYLRCELSLISFNIENIWRR